MNNEDARNQFNASTAPAYPSYVVNGWNGGANSASSTREPVDETTNDLGRKTAEFMAKMRAEAELIVSNAQKQVERIRQEMLAGIQREREALEKRAADLDSARKTLEEDFEAFEERRLALENDAFEKAREEGLRQGLEEGTKQGYEQGVKRANAEIEERVTQRVEDVSRDAVEAACAPIHKLVREMSNARQALLKNWEQNIMQIAVAIAYQTILREPSLVREVAIDLLREALDLAMNCAAMKIRMNPGDVKELREQIDAVREETGNLAKSEVVADPKITRGGCIVETSLGVVDERLETRLERIVAELS